MILLLTLSGFSLSEWTERFQKASDHSVREVLVKPLDVSVQVRPSKCLRESESENTQRADCASCKDVPRSEAALFLLGYFVRISVSWCWPER